MTAGSSQGNGTAKIFEGDDRVITFSVHGAKNYPWRTKMRSNYDVELDDATEDATYSALVEQWLPQLFDDHPPSLVFFQVLKHSRDVMKTAQHSRTLRVAKFV